MEVLVVIVALFDLFYCPLTKVEESFNVQAMHDILYHQTNLSEYDHLEFPGVVPRTFIGPLFVSLLSSPIVFLLSTLDASKIWSQIVVRAVLGLCSLSAFLRFNKAVKVTFGEKLSTWFLIVTATQYHFLFYITRPLPNIMALPLVLLALEGWLRKKHVQFIIYSGASIIIFRTELALFLGIILLLEFYYKNLDVIRFVKIAAPAGLGLLIATVVIDSIFWGRPLWPEGEVFFYNAVLNKSSNWGTSPFLWYFYSAIPRAMGASIFFLPIGCLLERRVRRLVLPAMAFVFLYSFLPHKELRFIIYVFPLLNVAVASACHRLWENRFKSTFQGLLALGAAGHVIGNVCFTVFLLLISSVNYPGGVALNRLHKIAENETSVYVHIDNLAAQTGVSRFIQVKDDWRYCKKENLTAGGAAMMQYTHLLVEAKSKYSGNIRPYIRTHDILESIDGFAQISINYNGFPPIKIKTKPMVFILRRRDDVEIPVLETESAPDGTEDMEKDFEEEVDIIVPKTEDSKNSLDEELKLLSQYVADEEFYEELNKLTEIERNNKIDPENLAKIKQTIKKLLEDYEHQLTALNQNKTDLNISDENVYTVSQEKQYSKNGNTENIVVDELVEVLSLKEAEIIKNDGTIDDKHTKKKILKKEKKKKVKESSDEEIADDGSWLSFFR